MGCILPAAFLLLSMVVMWCLWYFCPLTEEEQKQSQAQVETRTRYVLSADTTDIIAFTTTRGDTLLDGLRNAKAGQNVLHTIDTVVEVGMPKVLKTSSRMMSVTMTAMKMQVSS